MNAERGFIEKTAFEGRKLGIIGAFIGMLVSTGVVALGVGVAGLSHIIAKHEEKKRTRG